MHLLLIVGVILGAMPIPPKLQVPFAQRISRYDAAYPGAGKTRSYLIHPQGAPDDEAKEMVELLEKAGFVVRSVPCVRCSVRCSVRCQRPSSPRRAEKCSWCS